MSTPLPDLSAPVWTAKLAGLLERATLAIGRLDTRISVSPVRSAWLERACWTGFAAARRAQGAEIDEIDVFALACDAALPQRRPIAFAADERAALLTWQRVLAQRDPPHWRDRLPFSVDLPDDWRERPALLRGLELTGRHARAERSATPWLDSPALLASLGLTKGPLPCLVIADKALRLAPRDRDAIVPRFLKDLSRLAVAGLERLDALEANRLRGAKAVSDAGRPGALLALTALLQRRPLVSPLHVGRALGLTKSGAGKLLARAAEAGLTVEISGRDAWKLYLPTDLAVAFGYTPRSVGRPPALPSLDPLDPVLSRFDAEMAAIDARLAALGVASGAGA